MEQNWRPVEEMDRTHRWLMRGIVAIVVIVTAGLVWSIRSEARAQGLYMPSSEIKQILADRYGEVPVGGGVTPSGEHSVQVYASAGGATFSIVISGVSGTACIVAVGHDWTNETIEPAGRES